MDGITLSIAEMRRFSYMTGQNEGFCPIPFIVRAVIKSSYKEKAL
jgi:hypothetical protein